MVGIDLLQLPRSTQDCVYILVCADHCSRVEVLAPLRKKSAVTVAHAIVSRLICPYTTPRVFLSDNGTVFRNQILADICSQYTIKQTFITAHHPPSNGLVERTNMRVLEILLTYTRPGKILFRKLRLLLMSLSILLLAKLLTTSFLGMTKDCRITCF